MLSRETSLSSEKVSLGPRVGKFSKIVEIFLVFTSYIELCFVRRYLTKKIRYKILNRKVNGVTQVPFQILKVSQRITKKKHVEHLKGHVSFCHVQGVAEILLRILSSYTVVKMSKTSWIVRKKKNSSILVCRKVRFRNFFKIRQSLYYS